MFANNAPTHLTQQTLAAAQLAVVIFGLIAYPVVFDQGLLGAVFSERLLESGGILHELFHDARHVLGVPCH